MKPVLFRFHHAKNINGLIFSIKDSCSEDEEDFQNVITTILETASDQEGGEIATCKTGGGPSNNVSLQVSLTCHYQLSYC
jgi:hypothetical protein